MNQNDWEQYDKLLTILGVKTLFMFRYCPNCGKILSVKKTPIWSHDHSLRIGYTAIADCIFCEFTEVYHDVE